MKNRSLAEHNGSHSFRKKQFRKRYPLKSQCSPLRTPSSDGLGKILRLKSYFEGVGDALISHNGKCLGNLSINCNCLLLKCVIGSIWGVTNAPLSAWQSPLEQVWKRLLWSPARTWGLSVRKKSGEKLLTFQSLPLRRPFPSSPSPWNQGIW